MTENEQEKDLILKCKGGGSIIDNAPLFSQNGLSLIVPWRHMLRSFSTVNGERITDFEACDSKIINAHFHPINYKLLIACSSSGDILCWKWKTEILISKIKLNIELDEVKTFHIISPDHTSEDSCEILISWIINGEINLGVFQSKSGKLLRKIPLKIKSKKFLLDVGGKDSNQFVAVIEDTKLQCFSLQNKTEKPGRWRIGHGRKFTCLRCHPENASVATGDSLGRVLLWQNVLDGKTPAQAVYHWHTLPVRCLAFTQSGSELFSGADERVLVKWHLSNPHKKDYLPRLPAGIRHIAVSEDNLSIAVSTDDNGIRVLDTHFKLKCLVQHLVWGAPFTAGLRSDPTTKSLVLNGRPGHLQFYSPQDLTLLYNLDVVDQNQVSRERNIDIANTEVIHTALGRSGGSLWLATVERRSDGVDLRLKFWQFDNKTRSYTLNTSVEAPHDKNLTAIEFQPCTEQDMHCFCATASEDGNFKLWNLQDTSDIYRKSLSWTCSYVGYYKGLPARSLSFSSDGSLLAVAFGSCLTLWQPDTCHMRASLVHPAYRGELHSVRFGNVDQCHLVITASEDHLCVWNLLTLGLMWSVPVKLKFLTADPTSSHIAAITSTNSLFVFQPNSPSVLYSKTMLCSSGENVMAAVWASHGTAKPHAPAWQRDSRLFWITSVQELLCLESELEQLPPEQLEYTAQTERSTFANMLAATTTTDIKRTHTHKGPMNIGLTGSMTFDELLRPPVHTMAPMRLLCKSILRSAVRAIEPAKSDLNLNTDEEDDGLLDGHEDTEDSDETIHRRQRRDKPEVNDLNENSIDLRDVFTESTTWTSILV